MSDFDDAAQMSKVLGDFYANMVDNPQQIHDYVDSLVEAHKQDDINLEELQKSLSRRDIPTLHREKYVPLELTESMYLNQGGIYPNYDGTYSFNGQVIYGEQLEELNAVQIADDIISVGRVQDSPKDPKWSCVPTMDEYGRLVLDSFPFGANMPVELVYNSQGQVIDRRVTLWLCDVAIERENMYEQYGYAVGTRLPSSEQAKDAINALWDSLVSGPAESHLMRFVGAATGIPVIKEVSETVVSINGNVIKTDRHEYTAAPDDIITAIPGMVLNSGDTLTDGLKLIKPTDAVIDVPFISMDSNTTGICSEEPVVAMNEERAVDYEQDGEFIKTSFPVDGPNAEEFNDIMHQRGVENAQPVEDVDIIAQLNKILGYTTQAVYDHESEEYRPQAGVFDITQLTLGNRNSPEE